MCLGQPSPVQKRLNRLRCCLRYLLAWAQWTGVHVAPPGDEYDLMLRAIGGDASCRYHYFSNLLLYSKHGHYSWNLPALTRHRLSLECIHSLNEAGVGQFRKFGKKNWLPIGCPLSDRKTNERLMKPIRRPIRLLKHWWRSLQSIPRQWVHVGTQRVHARDIAVWTRCYRRHCVLRSFGDLHCECATESVWRYFGAFVWSARWNNLVCVKAKSTPMETDV